MPDLPRQAVRWPPRPGGTWILDLDGVVWLTGQPIPGAGEAVSALHRAGVGTLFVTNNSAPTVSQLLERLSAAGIDASPSDIVTSAQAAAAMLERGSRAMAVAEGGVVEALDARGVSVVGSGPVDAVVVGWTRRFDFDMLAAAASAVRAGARFIGTNEDPTHPTPDGLLPGGGSLLAAVAAAAETAPEVAGKPHRPLTELVKARAAGVTAAVGDRPATDGQLARQLSVPFALVLSGVTSPGDAAPVPAPATVAADLATLVRTLHPATPVEGGRACNS